MCQLKLLVHTVKTRCMKRSCYVRRISVSEESIVESGLSVKCPIPDHYVDWANNKQLKLMEVLTAGTILDGRLTEADVRLVNYCDQHHTRWLTTILLVWRSLLR